MASLIVPAIIAFLIAVAILHSMRKRAFACWLLVVLPASLCIATLFDLSRGPVQLGLGAYQSDQKQLAIFLAILALSLLAALRPRWRLLFWACWAINAVVCGFLVYLVFFWKVFS